MITIAEYYDEDMQSIDTPDMGTLALEIPSTPFSNRWVSGDGVIPVYAGADPEQRTINASIEMLANDYLDYQLLRDKLYSIFGFNQPFYLVDKRQPGKRFKVVLESNFTPERHSAINGTAVIPFTTIGTPYAESIGTTQDIEQNGIDSESELWGYGMGLIDEIGNYTHTGTSFSIYNAGIEVHPFQQDLKITIDNVQGGTEYFELKNETNGSTFRVEEDMLDSQVVILDGPNVTSNGLNFLRRTNKEFIELSPGWNDFTISGATSAQVSFDFRFYYR